MLLCDEPTGALDYAARDEVLVNQSFAPARQLALRDHVDTLLNGRRERLTLAVLVRAPEYVLAVHPSGGDDRSFGIFRMARDRLAAACSIEGAFNRMALRLGDDFRVDARIVELSQPDVLLVPAAAPSSGRGVSVVLR